MQPKDARELTLDHSIAAADAVASADVKQPVRPKLLQVLGPGLITGASDDDPSGIATYSQAGAQFGFDLGWTLIASWPLMCAIQEISARIGRVTGRGLAGNLKRHYPPLLVYMLIFLLVLANTINLGADLGAMAAALQLLIGGSQLLYVAMFAVISVLLEVFLRYSRYVSVLKWLSLSLFAYVGAALVVHLPWATVAQRLVFPHLSWSAGYVTTVAAILGTTISPYLFFWQAEQEVEGMHESPHTLALTQRPAPAQAEFSRIRWDTYLGMGLSNVVALFIVLTTAATLHAHGITDIQTSAQAAEALRPIAGRWVFLVFALGIIGTGLLALPVLGGSAAYALGELRGWPVGLARKLGRAKAFYATIAAATVVGGALNFSAIDPIKALFWCAVVNCIVAVPVMIMMMHLSTHAPAMGSFRLPGGLRMVGWLATAVMVAATIGVIVAAF